MNQSNIIFGFIFIAFLFYITAKGEIGTYLTILRGGGVEQNNSAGGTQNIGGALLPLMDIGQAFNADGSISDIAGSTDAVTGLLNNPITSGIIPVDNFFLSPE